MTFAFKNTMAVAGHRGDWVNCYENTMEAFQAAYDAVTSREALEFCCACGAKLVTTNNPADTVEKLKQLGKRT